MSSDPISDLRTRLAKLEREAEDKNLFQEEILEKVWSHLEENSEQYIPKLAQLTNDFRTFKRNVDKELMIMKSAQPAAGGASFSGDPGEMAKFEFENLRRTVAQLEHSLTDRVGCIQSEMDQQFEKIYKTMSANPLIGKVDTIENRLSGLVTLDRFKGLQDQLLMDYATNETIDMVNYNITRLDDKYVTKMEQELHTETFRHEIDIKLSHKIGMTNLNEGLDQFDSDLQQKLAKLQKSVDSIKKATKKLQYDFQDVVEVTNNQTELLKEKVDFEEIEKLWKNFEKYSMYEDLKDLYMKTVPEIYKFEGKIDAFRHDIDKQNEILRRFDEVISDKASKAQVKDVQAEATKKYAMVEDFMNFKNSLNERVAGNHKRIESLQEMIDLLGRTITKDIFSAVKRATSHLQMKNPGTNNGGTEMSQQLQDEFKIIVQGKADRQHMLDLAGQKANKIDTELAMRWIEVINRQLKQIIVMITEMLRFDVNKKDMKAFEGEQHISQTRAFLLQQALLISQWVNKFHTQSVNDYFLESSNGVTDLNWTPPEVLAFQKYAEEKLKGVDFELLRSQAMRENMKMRSKSVIQGGGSLAMTQGGGQQSPRINLMSPKQHNNAVIYNTKVHYSAQQQYKEPLSPDATMREQFPSTSLKKVRVNSGLRTLNNESTVHVFGHYLNSATSSVAEGNDDLRHLVESSKARLNNTGRKINNKQMLGQTMGTFTNRNSSQLSHHKKNVESGQGSVVGGQSLFTSIRKSLNFPGIVTPLVGKSGNLQ